MAERATGRGRKPTVKNAAETARGYASPACLMHEVDPAYFGLTREDEPVAKKQPRSRERAKGKIP